MYCSIRDEDAQNADRTNQKRQQHRGRINLPEPRDPRVGKAGVQSQAPASHRTYQSWCRLDVVLV